MSKPDTFLIGFGVSVDFAGDINNDGYNEVLFSSYGDSSGRGIVFIYTSSPTSVDEYQSPENSGVDYLYQNYPNPFNYTTLICYTLTFLAKEHVTLKIFNILGEEVKSLVNEYQQSGIYVVIWNAEDDLNKQVASGIYFCQLKTEKFSAVRKIVFLK